MASVGKDNKGKRTGRTAAHSRPAGHRSSEKATGTCKASKSDNKGKRTGRAILYLSHRSCKEATGKHMASVARGTGGRTAAHSNLTGHSRSEEATGKPMASKSRGEGRRTRRTTAAHSSLIALCISSKEEDRCRASMRAVKGNRGKAITRGAVVGKTVRRSTKTREGGKAREEAGGTAGTATQEPGPRHTKQRPMRHSNPAGLNNGGRRAVDLPPRGEKGANRGDWSEKGLPRGD